MCKCVIINLFGWMVYELLYMISLSLVFFLDISYIFFLFSFCHALEACGIPSLGMHLFFFFLKSCLEGMWHTFFGYASFISFCIAHIIDGNFRERESVTPGLQKNINRVIIYVLGSSHMYIQQNEQYITAHIT